MLKKILKPWFKTNPLLIVRALFYELGVRPRGWIWTKTCFCTAIYCDVDKAIGRAIYKNGVYELPTSELIWRLLKDVSSALFVDVGANIGYHSLLARKRLNGRGAVICFEPRPDIHEKLIINLTGSDVLAYKCALSSSNGQATLNIPTGSEKNDGLATLQSCTNTSKSITVQTIALDNFLDKDIFLLKIDVEGHEYSALLGAKSLLSRKRIRNVIFEDHNINDSAVATLLTSLGYTILSVGWDRNGLILKPFGESNSSFLLDAPNYIATLDALNVQAAARAPGWTVLGGGA